MAKKASAKSTKKRPSRPRRRQREPNVPLPAAAPRRANAAPCRVELRQVCTGGRAVVETIPALTAVGARRAPVTSPLRRGDRVRGVAVGGLGAVHRRRRATVVVSKDFAALCDEADLIFVGTVTEVESRWVDSSQQAIETLVTFGDLTWMYGTPQSSVTLRFAAARLDGLREEIAGAPQFARGERRVKSSPRRPVRQPGRRLRSRGAARRRLDRRAGGGRRRLGTKRSRRVAAR